jgi:hypothetical protein
MVGQAKVIELKAINDLHHLNLRRKISYCPKIGWNKVGKEFDTTRYYPDFASTLSAYYCLALLLRRHLPGRSI